MLYDSSCCMCYNYRVRDAVMSQRIKVFTINWEEALARFVANSSFLLPTVAGDSISGVMRKFMNIDFFHIQPTFN